LITFLVFCSTTIDCFRCPSTGLFANPNNQHFFYHCTDGIAYLKPCPVGLIWNENFQICDWLRVAQVDCDQGKQPNCREHSEWTPDGNPLVGSDNRFGSDASHLGSPSGVFIDQQSGRYYLYVADTDNHRVQKFDLRALNGEGITVAGGNGAGNATHQLNMPRAIYVDRSENIYIADDNNYRIQLWKKGATHGITIAGGFGKGSALNQIGGCHGLFVHEASNTLFISDFYNDRVVKWIPEMNQGEIVAGFGGGGSNASQLQMPRGIFVDACQNIYVADMWNHRIQKWKRNAREGITIAGGHGKGSAENQLNEPWAVMVDPFNNIYIADTSNHRIQKWASNGTKGMTIAGGHGQGENANQFKYAHGLALDRQGNIFVSEQRNHRVQIFHLQSSSNTC